MSQEWEVKFDVGTLLEEKFPGLYRPEDDEVWVEWAKWAGYRRETAKQMARIQGVSDSLKARATLARFLPSEFLPFHWEDKEQAPLGSYEKDFDKGDIKWIGISENIQKLMYLALCGFMESLPESTLFDLSDDRVAEHLPRVNNILLEGYLLPREKDERQWTWMDQDRLFACYRLQGQGQHRREHFRAFDEFIGIAEARKYEYWKQRANERMLSLIEREFAGDAKCLGALDAYLKLILDWHEWATRDEGGSPPISQSLAVLFAESYLGLGLPKEVDTYSKVFSTYIGESSSLRPDLVEEGCRYFLTGQQSLLAGEDVKRNQYYAARLSRLVLEVSSDPELLAIARPLAEADDRRAKEWAANYSARLEVERQAEEERKAETRRLLAKMRGTIK